MLVFFGCVFVVSNGSSIDDDVCRRVEEEEVEAGYREYSVGTDRAAALLVVSGRLV